MISMILYQRMWASGRLLKTNFKCRILQSFSNSNICNTNYKKTELLLKNKCCFIPKRHFFRLFKKATKEELKIKDDVPSQYTLIYRSTMDRYILYTQIITSATAVIVFFMCIFNHDFTNRQIDFSGWKSPPRQTENEILVYLSFFVIIVTVLQVMISRLPIRIYNLPQQKKYIFIFYGNYPFTQRKLVCKVGDIVPLPETGIMPWRQGRYLVKDQQKLLLMDQHFRRPADLHIMLGIQKDPDVDNEKE